MALPAVAQNNLLVNGSSTATLNFTADAGAIPAPQTVTLTTSNSQSVAWQIAPITQPSVDWLQLSANGGSALPADVTFAMNRILPAGTYQTALRVFSTAPGYQEATINVNITIGGGTIGTLTATPSPLVLTAPLGGSATGPLTVSHISGAFAPFSAIVTFQTGAGWLSPQVTSGTTPQTIFYTASAGVLPAGTYTATVTLTPVADGLSTTVQVQFNVGGVGTGPFGLNPQTLSFSVPVGGFAQQAAVAVQNSVGSFSATASVTTPIGGSWLSVSPTFSASSPATLTATANPSGLGLGSYTGTITLISQGGLTDFVYVTLNVGVTGPAALTVAPGALAFTATIGSGQTPTQILTVTSSTGAAIQFTAAPQVNWLTVSPTSGLTAASLTVQANSSLVPSTGTHSGSILITGGGTSVTVPVLFAVGTTVSTLNVSPSALTLSAISSGTIVSGLVFVNSNTGSAIGFTTQVSGAPWLSISSTSASTPASLTLTASPFGLASGVYGGFVIVQPLDGSTPQVVAVTLNVGTGAGNTVFSVSPASLTFSAAQGGPAVAPLVLTVSSLTGQSVNFTADVATQSGGLWVTADPTSAFANLSFPVVVSVNPAGLSAGTYQGTITITAQGLVTSIPVVLNVTGPPITLAPTSLSFTAVVGGGAPPAQTISVSSAATTSFTASTTTPTGATWLSVSPTSSNTPTTLSVSVNPSGLAAGTYTGQVRVVQAGAISPQVVNVTLTVTAVVAAQLVKVSGDGQNAVINQPFAQPLVVQVNDQQGQPVSGIQVSFSVASGSATLGSTTATTDAQGRASTTVQAGGAAGPIVVSASVSGLSATFNLSSRLPGPVVAAAGFVNAASGQPGVVAGSITTIQGAGLAPGIQGCVEAGVIAGPLPTTLAEVTVMFGAHLAPIFHVCNVGGREQVTVQAPWELGAGAVLVQITVGGGSSLIQGVPVVAAQPAIFETAGPDGRRYAVLARPDGTFVTPSNPARRGELVRIYATGLGPVLPLSSTNQPGVPEQAVYYPVIVGVNNAGVRVVSAEYAQNMIGVYVVTIEVPADTTPGPERPLDLVVQLPDGQIAQAPGSRFAIQ